VWRLLHRVPFTRPSGASNQYSAWSQGPGSQRVGWSRICRS
jgi:hypothetical protein